MRRHLDRAVWITLSLVGALAVGGCSEPVAEPVATVSTEAEATAKAKIDWFDGSVEEAFATAQIEDKPLFLYWGAEWCPPCHYLKNKVFTEPAFVDTSRRFVAVYLDGDTDQAQAWGEYYKTAGYPTVIVFDSDATEIIRMTSGIPATEYSQVLDTALARMRPVLDTLDELLEAGVETADPLDLELLAYHSWDQDRRVEKSDAEMAEAFGRLWSETPASMSNVRSRFLANAVAAATGAELELSDEARESYRRGVLELLDDPAQRNNNVYFVFYYASDVVDYLTPGDSPGRAELIATWQRAATAAEDDESLSTTDRIASLYAQMELAQASAGPVGEGEEPSPLPDDVVAHVSERVEWANDLISEDSELQAAMNTMCGVLETAGLFDQARQLLTARLDDTTSPYYYMSWMSSIEEDTGHPEEALEWSRRAYDTAEGTYTRFQWGYNYIRALLRIAPADTDTIDAASREVFSELLAHDDAFANRNYTRLQRLDSAYTDWAETEERIAVRDGIRDLVAARCTEYSADGEDPLRERCTAFLAG